MPFKQHPDNPDLVIYEPNEYWIPKPWVGLTDAHISLMTSTHKSLTDLCRAIEAKLKELNT